MSASDELISFRYASFREFLDTNSGSLSTEGMFVETDRPRPVGSRVRFELTVSDDFMLFRGVGEVAWARDSATDSGARPGMAIRFDEVVDPGRRLLEKVVLKFEEEGVEPFELEPPAGSEEVTAEALLGAEALPSAPADPTGRGDEGGETTLEEFLRQDTPLTSDPGADLELLEAESPAPESLVSESPAPEVTEVEEPVVEDRPPEVREAEEAPVAPDPVLDQVEDRAAPDPGTYRPFPSAERMTGSQVARGHGRTGRRRVWLLALLLLVLAVAAAYLFRDELTVLLSTGGAAGEPATGESAAIGEPEPASSGSSVGEAYEGDAETGPEPEVGGGELDAGEAAGEASGPPAAVFTGIDDINWREEGAATVIVIHGDGPVPLEAISNFRVDVGRPREVVEILGVSRAFRGGTLQVDGPNVQRIRTGYRREEGGVLRLVTDLAGDGVRLRDISVDGSEIELTLAGGG